MAKSAIHGSVFPKLQVVKKDGFYFTLNDAKLQVYRHLEKLGKCGRVEVERIALKEVPEGIMNLMKAPERVRRCTGRKAKSNIRGKYTSVSSSAAGDVSDGQDLVLDGVEGDDVCSSDEESSDFCDTNSDSSDWSDEDDVSGTEVEADEDKRGRRHLNEELVKKNARHEHDSGAHSDENESFI